MTVQFVSPVFLTWGSSIPGQTEAEGEPVPGGDWCKVPGTRMLTAVAPVEVPSTTSIVEAGQTDIRPEGPLDD